MHNPLIWKLLVQKRNYDMYLAKQSLANPVFWVKSIPLIKCLQKNMNIFGNFEGVTFRQIMCP